METSNLILTAQFCTYHNVEFSFITALHNAGLVEIIVVEDNQYLSLEQLKEIEKMIAFHYELNINIEGIDAITNLLKQINELQQELVITKNKLRLYEIE
jgi:signal transduction histidine kinase